MNKTILIKNAKLINEGEIFQADLLIEGEYIKTIDRSQSITEADQIIDASGKYLIPGMIDDQVHFRDPGLTHKGDLYTESRAAVAGGITSFMEMPNTVPRALTQDLLEDKYKIAAEKSFANYSFYMGTANDNLEEVLKTDPATVCGIKIFLGASTGNMLVDNPEVIEEVLKYSAQTGLICTVHSEDEATIVENAAKYKAKYGDEIDIKHHPEIRSREACYKCTKNIIGLAQKHKANLHVLHISTKEELELFDAAEIDSKYITAEACVHHLWFTDQDYTSKGSKIKWNPAIKAIEDREAIRVAVNQGRIDIIATDHAPHTIEEKTNSNYFKCAAGGPLVQHALPALFEMYHQGVFSLETIVQKTSHNIAKRFKIDKRGFLQEGYYADLTLVNLNKPWTVDSSNILYKCGWSPFEGDSFKSSISHTIINGSVIYQNGKFCEKSHSQRLAFVRS
ncbi:MAG: dihydroorotase [Cyanobacteria bacterium]|nr:dihydroorotase [Cyanobacteriota bacterium]MDA1020846.1 dihydroorotase [Cyanobacteriota bacterium]